MGATYLQLQGEKLFYGEGGGGGGGGIKPLLLSAAFSPPPPPPLPIYHTFTLLACLPIKLSDKYKEIRDAGFPDFNWKA